MHRKIMVGFIIGILSFHGTLFSADSKTTALALRWNSNVDFDHWLFEPGAKYTGPANLSSLAKVKQWEYAGQYEACTQQVLSHWNRYSEFRGWMALQGTRCLLYQMKFLQPNDKKIYSQWWHHLFRQGDWIFFGPWTNDLIREWADFAQWILKSKTLPLGFKREVAETWRRYLVDLNQSKRKEIYQVIVDHLREEGQGSVAEAIALREELIPINKKNLVPPGGPNSSSSSSGSAKNVPGFTANPLSGEAAREEARLNNDFQSLLRSRKWVAAAQVGVKSLDRFPTGQWSSSLFEKLQQNYFKLWGSANSEKEQKELFDYLDAAQLLHPALQTTWARSCHRRGDFHGAYTLAKWALAEDEKSPTGADLLFIAGRSAYLSGRYQEAIEFFNRLDSRHYAYSEIREARFRRALAWIRIGEDQKAEESLGELVGDPGNDAYGVSSLYWLIRLKQKRKADAGPWLKFMQDKFALTYYGLRLNAEANGQKVQFEPPEKGASISLNWVLTPEEKKQWDRVQDLVTAGWYEAAQGEMNNFVLDGSPEHRFLWATQLVKVFAFPQAIRLLNQLIEEDSKWRRVSYLKNIFPKPLKFIVNREASKNALDADLVYSLIRQESAFSLKASSGVQAMGLMQVIPETANEIAREMKIKSFNSDQMFQPEINVKFGTYYLAKVIRQFGGNVSVGLAAYNAGPQRLKRFFSARPEVQNTQTLSQEDPWTDLWMEELPWLETNLYVKSILRNRVIYEVLEQGSFVWPSPLWKNLFKGNQESNQEPNRKDSV